jgi:hypothetical protein
VLRWHSCLGSGQQQGGGVQMTERGGAANGMRAVCWSAQQEIRVLAVLIVAALQHQCSFVWVSRDS